MSQISCDTIGPLLSAFVDGEVDASERQRVEEHTSCCSVCASHLGFLQALHRAPGAPVRVAPPADLAEIVARATFAKPTWQERLAQWLRPAPVRVGLAGAFVAAFGVTVYQRMPSPVTPSVASGVVHPETPRMVPPPMTLEAPPRGLVENVVHRVAPPAPPVVAPVSVRVASISHPAPRQTQRPSRPEVRIDLASFRTSSGDSATRIAADPARRPEVALSTRTTAATIMVTPAATTRTVSPTVSDSVPSAAPTPAPALPVARASTSAHELVRDDDDSDARASYEAGLLAQSESSRRRIGGAAGNGNALLSVVRAPVTTSNH